MSEQIRREFTLAFPIEKVKASIEDACKTSQGSYSIKDRNAAFNSYNMLLVKNLYWLPTTVTLRAVGENETHFELSALPGPKLTRMSTFTTTLIEEFLGRVGDYASGRYVYTPPTHDQVVQAQAQEKSGGVGLLIIIIAVIAAAIMYIYSRK